MLEGIRLDIAAALTALSLIIGSIGTLIIAVRNSKPAHHSREKAIAVTRINDTDKKVETLREQVDFLFDEIGKLRIEKDKLVEEVARLRAELKTERRDHSETKRELAIAEAELKDKTERIEALEGISRKD